MIKNVIVTLIMVPFCIVLAVGAILVAFSLFGIDHISDLAYPQEEHWSA